MRNLTLLSATVFLAAVGLAQTAAAIPQFQAQFLKLYINEHPDPEFTAFVKQDVKCWACHQGKKRKNRNVYGEQLSELLDKKEDRKNVEKIIDALKQVAEKPFNPDDEDGETFGERIAASKLPGADSLDELKTEPKEPE